MHFISIDALNGSDLVQQINSSKLVAFFSKPSAWLKKFVALITANIQFLYQCNFLSGFIENARESNLTENTRSKVCIHEFLGGSVNNEYKMGNLRLNNSESVYRKRSPVEIMGITDFFWRTLIQGF